MEYYLKYILVGDFEMNKTENIMNYAITMVPYYCQFRKATFEEFPIISKKDIKKDYELF